MMTIITLPVNGGEWVGSGWMGLGWVGEWTFLFPILESNLSSPSVACCHGPYFLWSVANTQLRLVSRAGTQRIPLSTHPFFHSFPLSYTPLHSLTHLVTCSILHLMSPDLVLTLFFCPNSHFYQLSIPLDFLRCLNCTFTHPFSPQSRVLTFWHTGIPNHSVSIFTRFPHSVTLAPSHRPFHTWLTFLTPFYTLPLPSTALSHAAMDRQTLKCFSSLTHSPVSQHTHSSRVLYFHLNKTSNLCFWSRVRTIYELLPQAY